MAQRSWLNNSFLENALRHEAKDPTIVVVSSEIKLATVPGDNYASQVYRAELKVKRENVTEDMSVVIKVMPFIEGQMNEFLQENDLFIKESKYFSNVVPAMEVLLKRVHPENYQPISAKYIYSTSKPTSIILEDLKKKGFRLSQVKLGLDLNHSLLVLRKIARFHACSLVLANNEPGCFDAFKECAICHENAVPFENYLKVNTRSLAEEVDKWDEYKNKYSDILHSLIEPVMAKWIKGMRRDDAGFNVLIHGDLALNNLMFKYSEDTGDVQDVRFVDFQMSYWTSPAVDLHYFMNSSVSPDVLENRDVLINEYYNELCETLSRLGHESLKPTLEVLNDELNKRSICGLLTGINIRVVALSDRSKVPDMSKVVQNKATIYLSENYKQSLKLLLPLYEKWGWLKF